VINIYIVASTSTVMFWLLVTTANSFQL